MYDNNTVHHLIQIKKRQVRSDITLYPKLQGEAIDSVATPSKSC